MVTCHDIRCGRETLFLLAGCLRQLTARRDLFGAICQETSSQSIEPVWQEMLDEEKKEVRVGPVVACMIMLSGPIFPILRFDGTAIWHTPFRSDFS